MRILMISLIFAASHMSNEGTYLDTAETVTQVALQILFPIHSILFETLGGSAYSMLSHITVNSLSYVQSLFWG